LVDAPVAIARLHIQNILTQIVERKRERIAEPGACRRTSPQENSPIPPTMMNPPQRRRNQHHCRSETPITLTWPDREDFDPGASLATTILPGQRPYQSSLNRISLPEASPTFG
jgi:hypothetical protein